MAREHPLKPFYSVLVLAFACSALVAAAAVGLKPYQEANQALDRKKNILAAAGLYQESLGIDEQFGAIETRLVDLASGTFVDDGSVDPASFDQLDAARSDATGMAVAAEDDIAGIRRREQYSLVYLVKDGDALEQIILPVRGKGLWSTMYGYVAVAGDLSTVRGVRFYEHGETPGLGGEIENPRWQEGWRDKRLYNQDEELAISVVKGGSQTGPEDRVHQIDGLSGATLTSQGVDNLLRYWFGDHGFKPFLDRLRSGGLNG